ncbi:MerR family transcriptional regulator [Geminocystis sp. NIES-3708]|uniref:MerR family transcriptional regulator n=1 Tax=Geminocystis sp. NIES-3708 TaxID=1615909 RepID=UPI0008373035|nr:MerR family transcriptional regulator [Geminocystis sp. NIES-3708]
MKERFFSSKEASLITGCSLRQLQYWRDKEIIVPFIHGSGTGKTIYYSPAELVEVSIMVYLLSMGLSFEIGQIILHDLREKEPDFRNPDYKRRFMIIPRDGKMHLLPYEREKAIALLEEGKVIMPLWLDKIHRKLGEKVG